MQDEQLRRLVLRLFLASGCSGLMYQVVWVRMLTRMFGVTIYATSTVVAAFMAGLALGSYAFGRYVDRQKDPLRLYGQLELMISGCALLVPLLLAMTSPLILAVATSSGGNQAVVASTRVAIAFVVLLIPTTLMGGTLPVLTAFLSRRAALFGESFGLLYSLNTAGAVLGVMLSGFVTIGLLGERATTAIAALVNVGVGVTALLVARRLGVPSSSSASASSAGVLSGYSGSLRQAVLLGFALSGFTALAYEIIWTRQLILFLRTSVYAFSGMLAVFLIGIGAGSLLISRVVDRWRSPLLGFAILELAVAVVSVVSLQLYVPLDGPAAYQWLGALRPLSATVVLVLPLTLLFGMIAPVAAVCYAGSRNETGSAIGRIYAANTVGSILGALATGFLLLPRFGATSTVLGLAAINLAIGMSFLVLERSVATGRRVAIAVPAVLVLLLTAAVGTKDPFRAAIESRIERRIGVNELPDSNAALPASQEIHFHREGKEATITAFEVNRYKQLWVNGVGMTVLTTATKLMAHLPLLIADDSKQLLVIAFGMGTTTRSASRHDGLSVTAVDIVPETFETFRFYHRDADSVLANPRVKTVANDGRNFLLLSRARYDVITIDPAPPIWSAGTVNLYSREFFELTRKHLAPGGVTSLWFPEGTEVEVKSLLATFLSVYPNATIWDGPSGWGWYLIGAERPLDWERFRSRLDGLFAVPALAADMIEYDSLMATPDRVMALYKWSASEARRESAGARMITDDFPLTEFPLWRYYAGQSGPWHPTTKGARP
jgi:spermidine synthase